MIATTRGLAILAGIAALLIVVLRFASPRGASPIDRSLVPGFDQTKVTELVFTRGDRTVRITRVKERWEFADSRGAHHPATVADPAAIDAIFTALRGGRWHRRADESAARIQNPTSTSGGSAEALRHATAASLTVHGTTLAMGAPVASTGQTWLIRGDVALLVDSWIAAALVPEPLALRVRHPLDCTSPDSLIARTTDGRDVVAEGRRLVLPRALWLGEDSIARLATACAAIEIVAFTDHRTTTDSSAGLSITANGTMLRRVGTCAQSRIHVATNVGAGCVETDALRSLEDVIAAISNVPGDAIDRRPLPIDPITLTLRDGTLLELSDRPRIGEVDADPDAVRALVRALTTPGQATLLRPAMNPTGAIKAVDRAGVEVTLELFADNAIGRAGEPGVIRIEPRDFDLITRPSAALRDATRWREDALTLTSLTLDNVTYTRGAVIGEWMRNPVGTIDPALVDALVESLAHVRAPTAAPPKAIEHRLAVTFTPPAGAARTHVIEFSAPHVDGCPARLDGMPVLVPMSLCTAALALASVR